MRLRVQLLWIGVLLTACAVPATSTPAAAPIPVKACYSALAGTSLVAMYALEEGLFAKHGLAVDLVYIDSGSKALTAMIAGDMDVCQVAGSAVINAAVAGAEVKMIAGLYNTYVYSLMVAPEIQTPEDLVGKAVAISQPGSSSDFAIRAALKGMGLEADTDVAVLAVGGQSERMAAMLSGQVVGTLVTVPETVKARALGFHELLDMASLGEPYQHTGIAARSGFIEDNRPAALAFLKATAEAIQRMQSDPEGTAAVLTKYLLLDPVADEEAIAETQAVMVVRYLEKVPYPTVPGIERALEELVVENPQAAGFDPQKVVDLTLMTELEESGFFTDLAAELSAAP